MKKYEVKAGQAFDVDAVNVVIQLNVGERGKSTGRFGWPKVLASICIALVAAIALAPIAYGAMTGDYTQLKELSELSPRALKLLLNVLQSK
jgi:hypothetical protein